MLEYRQQNWQAAMGAALRALDIKDRELVYTVDPEVWGYQPHDIAAISAWNLGLKDIAIEQGQLAVDKAPNDGRLIANLALYNSANDTDA